MNKKNQYIEDPVHAKVTKYEVKRPGDPAEHEQTVKDLTELVRGLIESDLTNSPAKIPDDGYVMTLRRFTKKC